MSRINVDVLQRQIIMYYHCPAGSGTSLDIGQQKTFVALSADGINFSSRPQALGPAYFRVFRWQGYSYAIVRAGILFRSRDPVGAYEEGRRLFSFGPGVLLRHAAVDLRGNELWVYYSRIGDRPERILVSRVTLAGDWSSWHAKPPETVLSPDMPYEGSAFPLEVSRPDEAQQVRQLRDPAVYREGPRTYLVYSIAGESGLAIAELRYR